MHDRSRVGRVAASAVPLNETLLAKLASTRRTPRLRAATLPRLRRRVSRTAMLLRRGAVARSPAATASRPDLWSALAATALLMPAHCVPPPVLRQRTPKLAPCQHVSYRRLQSCLPLPRASTLIQVARCGKPKVWMTPACWPLWASSTVGVPCCLCRRMPWCRPSFHPISMPCELWPLRCGHSYVCILCMLRACGLQACLHAHRV